MALSKCQGYVGSDKGAGTAQGGGLQNVSYLQIPVLTNGLLELLELEFNDYIKTKNSTSLMNRYHLFQTSTVFWLNLKLKVKDLAEIVFLPPQIVPFKKKKSTVNV